MEFLQTHATWIEASMYLALIAYLLAEAIRMARQPRCECGARLSTLARQEGRTTCTRCLLDAPLPKRVGTGGVETVRRVAAERGGRVNRPGMQHRGRGPSAGPTAAHTADR